MGRCEHSLASQNRNMKQCIINRAFMGPSLRGKCRVAKIMQREAKLYPLSFSALCFHLDTEAMQWVLEVFDIF